MKRLRRIALVIITIVTALAIGAALFLPRLGAMALENKLQDSLTKRDLDASWSGLEVDWQGRLELSEFSFVDDKRGIKVEVARALVEPTIDSLWARDPEIKRIEVEGMKLEVDVERATKLLEREERVGDDDAQQQSNSTLRRLKKKLLEAPPEVTFTESALLVKRGEEELLEIESSEATLDPADDRLVLDAKGKTTPVYAKLPGILKAPIAWGLSASVGLESRDVEIELDSGEEGKALFALDLPGVASVSLGKARLFAQLGSEGKSAAVELEELEGLLGERERMIAAVDADTLSIDLLAAKPHVHLQGAVIDVVPSRLGELGELKGKLNPFAKSSERLAQIKKKLDPAPKAPSPLIDAKVTKLLELGARVNRATEQLEVGVDSGTLALHLKLEDDKLQRIEFIEQMNAQIEQGSLDISGDMAGGSFNAAAKFAPGQPLPHLASMSGEDINIEQLPGLDQGRTLPNRGVRGKIGGVVDFSANMALSREIFDLRDLYGEVAIETKFEWRDGMLDLNGVAEEPLTGIELEGASTITWRPSRSELELERGEFNYNGLTAKAEGTLRDWPLAPMLRAEISMPETECQDMISAMPDAMLGPYKNVRLAGSAAPILRVKYPLLKPSKLKIDLDGLAEEDTPEIRRARRRAELEPLTPAHKTYYCRVTALNTAREGWPDVELASAPGSPNQAQALEAPPSWRGPKNMNDAYWLNRPFVKRVTEGVDEDVEVLVGPGLDTYVSLSDMPAWVGAAAYLSEEILFYSNKGVSFGLIQKALRINLERGRFVYGGSTVTQQLVKNLFLTRDKTLARKLQEALVSLRMDEVVSKDRILELYLNCIEFGRNLYGIGPAAKFYFNKHPRDLTPMEAIFLAVIKPSPSYGGRLKRRGKLPPEGTWFARRIETIFARMVEYELLTQEEADEQRPYELRWDSNGDYVPAEPKPKTLEELISIPLLED